MSYYAVNGANNITLGLLYIFTFFLCHGDIEWNPRPKRLKPNNLSICHWNLSSTSVHNFSKIAQLESYSFIYKHDLFVYLKHT